MAKKAERVARRARIACEKWRQYFHVNIDQYHRMFDFILGKQWSDDEEDMLKTFRKIPLQFNKLGTLANSLIGEQQQNTPQLEVVPLSNCDEKTASIRQMVIKDLILSTDAKTTYQVAASQSFIGGYGAFMWDTQYTHNRSFDLDIVPRYFKDATRVYWDVGAEHVNKTDGMFCGYIARMTRQKFRETYGKDIEEQIAKESSITATESEIALATEPRMTDDPFSWSDDNGITINHYFERKYKKETLYKLSNGQVLDQAEMEKLISDSIVISEQMQQMPEYSGQEMQPQMPQQQPMDQQSMGQQPMEQPMDFMGGQMEAGLGEYEEDDDMITLYYEGESVRIEEKREIKKSTIIYRKIAGDFELEKVEFPSEDLPIIFVDQNSYYQKDGKQMCRPFFIDAIDAQRYLNYLGTQSAYVLKVSRYDQFIGPKKAVQSIDTQQKWQDPYAVQGLLTYDGDASNKPEQIRPPELSQSLVQQYERAVNDMYTSSGLYPSRLGQEGNETSGVAIDARTRQGSYPTFVAFNSVNRAITAGGQIVNQMVPRVYDSQRILNLMTPDEGRKNVTVNKQIDEYGLQIENDLRKGTFEVRLQAGPSFEGQKQEALNSLNMVLQANPQLLNLFADLYADNLPLSNTIEIKNRLKTIVPPEIIEAGKTGKMPQGGQPNPEQQAQQQAMQADQQFKQAQIQIKQQELMIKQKEFEAKIEIERMKVEIAKMELSAGIEEGRMKYLAEDKRTDSDAAISHADNLVKILTHKTREPRGGMNEA